jgi:hypothetical protein
MSNVQCDLKDGESEMIYLVGFVDKRQGLNLLFVDKSSLKRSFLTMQCERSGEYKPPKTSKKLILEV